MVPSDVLKASTQAVRNDDEAALRRLLQKHPQLKAEIDDPVGDFGSPLIVHVRSVAVLDVLLDAGADINARSSWAPGSFGLLDFAPPVVAEYALQRGAHLTIHAAARLGKLEKIKEFVSVDPACVHEPGGDGQTPLHFASTVEVAAYLIDHGAKIDARDSDHLSTAAQHMLSGRQGIARYLVQRGCTSDILMAAALGDAALVRWHLQRNPACIRMRVSDEYFPMVGGGTGGTIYQWQLGWYVSAVQAAYSFGHMEIVALLNEHCPDDEKLLNACWMHDKPQVQTLLEKTPDLVQELTPAGQRQLAHAARNNDTEATELFLEIGLPLTSASQHRLTPLHWAAWHGNLELVNAMLAFHPELEDRTNDFNTTPLEATLHGSENAWHRERGQFPETVEALLLAGSKPPANPRGSDEVLATLRKFARSASA